MTRTVQLLRDDVYNWKITSAWRVQLHNYGWNQGCWWPIRFESFDIVVIIIIIVIIITIKKCVILLPKTSLSTYIIQLRKELNDVLNDWTFPRQTKTLQEWTKGFIYSQIMEMKWPENSRNLLQFDHSGENRPSKQSALFAFFTNPTIQFFLGGYLH